MFLPMAQSMFVCPHCQGVLMENRPLKSAAGGIGVTISTAIQELLAAKVLANRRAVYIKSLKSFLNQFAFEREQTPLENFTFQDIEAWMNRYKFPWARHTWLNRLSTLFSFAVRRRWIEKNPCDCVERVSVDHKPPTVLSVAQVEILLAKCPANCKAWLVLALFAGVRPDGELMAVKWEDVNLATASVKINFPKVRKHRRIVPLESRAVALLRDCEPKEGNLSPSHSTLRRFKRGVCAELGFETWPQDVLRHTAASFLMALHKDVGRVATMLGNSPDILLSHYHEPVSAADAKAFWAVSPATH